MVPAVVQLAFGIHVVPAFVVDRHSHFRRITVIQVVGALVVLAVPEVLRIVDVGIMVQAVPIAGAIGAAPLATISLLGLGLVGRQDRPQTRRAAKRKQGPADHRDSPLGVAKYFRPRRGQFTGAALALCWV